MVLNAPPGEPGGFFDRRDRGMFLALEGNVELGEPGGNGRLELGHHAVSL